MNNKKPFKRVNIEEVKAQKVVQEKLDELMSKVDEAVDSAMISLLNEMGYPEAQEGMTFEQTKALHKKMKEAGSYVDIQHEQKGNKLVVTLKVVQEARVLEFDLTAENEEG
jgi:hypothetical protein